MTIVRLKALRRWKHLAVTASRWYHGRFLAHRPVSTISCPLCFPCRCQPWATLQVLTCGPWSCLKGPEQQEGRPAKHHQMAARELWASLIHACLPGSLVGTHLWDGTSHISRSSQGAEYVSLLVMTHAEEYM